MSLRGLYVKNHLKKSITLNINKETQKKNIKKIAVGCKDIANHYNHNQRLEETLEVWYLWTHQKRK